MESLIEGERNGLMPTYLDIYPVQYIVVEMFYFGLFLATQITN